MTRRLVAENWRLEQARYTLRGSHCVGCDIYHFPHKELCLKCKTSDNLKNYLFSGNGKLVEWTTIHEAATGFEGNVPYLYGIIELDEGIRISTQITGAKSDNLSPGMKVSVVFRKLFQDGNEGLVTYGFKAVPA